MREAPCSLILYLPPSPPPPLFCTQLQLVFILLVKNKMDLKNSKSFMHIKTGVGRNRSAELRIGFGCHNICFCNSLVSAPLFLCLQAYYRAALSPTPASASKSPPISLVECKLGTQELHIQSLTHLVKGFRLAGVGNIPWRTSPTCISKMVLVYVDKWPEAVSCTTALARL